MEDAFYPAHALPPPIKIACPHRVPAVKRTAPVLSPFLRELVFLEKWFRRRAGRPIERELVTPREDIDTVVTDAERDVAHQGDAALVRKRFKFAPLLMGDPLHIAKEILPLGEGRLSIQGEATEPIARGFGRLIRPCIPVFALAIFFHERAEEDVTIQPGGFFLAKLSKIRLSIFVGLRGAKTSKSFFQQVPIQFFNLRVFHWAASEPGKIDIGKRRRKVICAQIFRTSRGKMERRRLDRHCADRVVRAVVSTDFVNRQQLH